MFGLPIGDRSRACESLSASYAPPGHLVCVLLRRLPVRAGERNTSMSYSLSKSKHKLTKHFRRKCAPNSRLLAIDERASTFCENANLGNVFNIAGHILVGASLMRWDMVKSRMTIVPESTCRDPGCRSVFEPTAEQKDRVPCCLS